MRLIRRVAMGLSLMALTIPAWAEPAITIYNGGFAVVRDMIKLDLQVGENKVDFNDITAQVMPDSVVLRDPAGQRAIQILEQNYRSDPISEGLLLNHYEGQTIEFSVPQPNAPEKIVAGKIIRSGYIPHATGMRRYDEQYQQRQMAYANQQGGMGQPIIEVEGKLQFGMPGRPIFPALTDDTILKPAFSWVLNTDAAGPLDAELSYMTNGMSWEANYNLIAPEEGDVVDVIGWITLDNQTGKTFENAKLKLVAGDVNRIQPNNQNRYAAAEMSMGMMGGMGGMPPVVREKTFDEYHMYTVARPATVHDRETKQIEFVRAANIPTTRFYVYDGFQYDRNRYGDMNPGYPQQDQNFGTQCNKKIWVVREFKNTTENGLGIPLPKGILRFYRKNADDGQLEFTGENLLDHTPVDETTKAYTGNAFDIVGERIRTNFQMNSGPNMMDEEFKIVLRNHKKEMVEVRVTEHMYRWQTWQIVQNSHTFNKTDAKSIEFRVQLDPDEEETITYKVHYQW